MIALRFLFMLTCLVYTFIVLARMPWEGRFRSGTCNWIVHLDDAPLWDPPPMPSYGIFFTTFDNLPAIHSGVIYRVCRWEQALVKWLLYLWGITALYTVAYLCFRGARRDLLFHCVIGSFIGLTCGAAATVGVGIAYGGFGPPVLQSIFGLAGLVVGIFGALFDWSVGDVER